MKQKSNVSFGLKAAYGCGDLGLNLFSMAVGSFITSYYTDSVLMGAAFVGTMMLVARCFDGISDIIMGIIIDHTNTKIGKARPWVLICAIPVAISLVLLFSVPSGLSQTGKMVYIYVTYIFSQVVCGTAGNLSVSTLCTFMSPDLQVRAELAGARTLGSNVGSLIAFLVPANLTVVLVGLVIRTFGLGIFVSNLFASVADVADYVDLTNHVSIAGVTNSVTSFGMKVGVGLGSATVGWVLAIVGYSAELANAGEMQSAMTIFGERLCYTGIPAIFTLIVFILSCFVDVDTKLKALRA